MHIINAQLTSIIRGLQARLATSEAGFLTQSEAIWKTLERKFGTLLGQPGVELLLGRSLKTLRAQYPWLPSTRDAQFAKLFECYAQQDIHTAVAANHALLHAFIHLLAALIGASLTVTFLRSAFGDDGVAPISMEN